MSTPPTGTVTFLFTDIEGSTLLARRNPAAWEIARARHHSILPAAIEAHGGHIFQVIGDAFCAAFHRAIDALDAASEAQQNLQAEPWGEAILRVRMGLHTGNAELRAGQYDGYLTLAHVQRIMNLAHGGQVLLSQSTAQLLSADAEARESSGATLEVLGTIRLKDFAQSERLYQLVVPGLLSEFPPLATADAIPNNLPVQLTSFIGRERELSELQRRLASTHLLTLTGSGGTGKTRLSLQLAANVLNDFRDGIWLVELAPLSDPDLIPQMAMSALGLREQPGQPLLSTLTEYLRDKQLLFILDNCEHILEASARLADALLHAAPKLKILASSREGLGIAGETSYRVPSLEIPNSKDQIPTSALRRYAAVELFVERAAAAKADFALNESNAQAVAQICSRLDGIPLAIELAAARVKSLPVETIAARLDDRFRLLTGGSRTALPRQQTLRGMIDWSYSLLSESERNLLQRLSVFAGGWSIEAAEAVCASPSTSSTLQRTSEVRPIAGVPSQDVLDLLSHLVDKSLVVLDEQSAEPRYHLLETVRQYAREKLFDSGQGEPIRAQHLDFYTHLVEMAEREYVGPHASRWFDRLEFEHDNLRAALEHALESQDRTIGLRLAAALNYFWTERNHHHEGRGRLSAILTRTAGQSTPARAKALDAAAFLAIREHDYADARTLLAEAVQLSRDLSDSSNLTWALHLRGMVALAERDLGLARAVLEESLHIHKQVGNAIGMADALEFLAEVTLLEGEYAKASEQFEEVARRYRALNNTNVVIPLRRLAQIRLHEGDLANAGVLGHEALTQALANGDKTPYTAVALAAAIAAHHGQLLPAAQLLAALQSFLNTSHGGLLPVDQHEYDRTLEKVRSGLDPERFNAAWAEGGALTMEQAIAVAQLATRPAPRSPTPMTEPSGLTARELVVLRLLADGLSNDQIAERLVVSIFTVRAHLRAIYGKLGVTTRSAATRYALEHHLV